MSPRIAERGIGGTGLPAARIAERGIGGTGINGSAHSHVAANHPHASASLHARNTVLPRTNGVSVSMFVNASPAAKGWVPHPARIAIRHASRVHRTGKPTEPTTADAPRRQ